MEERDTQSLEEELEQFKREKEKIRQLVGRIGGAGSNRRDMVVNIVFIAAIATLLVADGLRHIAGWNIPGSPVFSIELGVLMVSAKIIWMIHKQSKVEHFQFWILNSIEFRLNDVAKRMKELEKRLQ
jgi:hypothetical protein